MRLFAPRLVILFISSIFFTWLALCLALPCQGQTRKVSINSSLRLELSAASEKALTGTLRSDKSLPKTSIFTLDNPGRIVIDLLEKNLKANKIPAISNLGPVNTVRVGTHPDKLRVVIEFSETSAPQYSLTQEDKGIEIEIGGNPIDLEPEAPVLNSAAASKSTEPEVKILKLERKPALPDQPAWPADDQTASVKAAAIDDPQPPRPASSPAPQIPTPAATAPPAQTPDGLVLRKIDFSSSGPTHRPALLLELSKRSSFRLNKKDDRNFELVINDCGLDGEHLALPQFPPQYFEGLEAVVASKTGDTVKVALPVSLGTRLRAVALENQIVIEKAE
ncbi:MAG: hypothetical protein DCC75_09605 [Proteobacteria bacterium]|nr:MAG: hypothetical protein DCC75_09605 [Pseudomonadota bacterium]